MSKILTFLFFFVTRQKKKRKQFLCAASSGRCRKKGRKKKMLTVSILQYTLMISFYDLQWPTLVNKAIFKGDIDKCVCSTISKSSTFVFISACFPLSFPTTFIPFSFLFFVSGGQFFMCFFTLLAMLLFRPLLLSHFYLSFSM